jgi:hypothetical protein
LAAGLPEDAQGDADLSLAGSGSSERSTHGFDQDVLL